MHHELIWKAIAQGLVGIIFLTILAVLFVLVRKDIRERQELSRIVVFAMVILSFWSLFAFAEVYVSIRKLFTTQSPVQAGRRDRVQGIVPSHLTAPGFPETGGR
jgi:hypothetical protein